MQRSVETSNNARNDIRCITDVTIARLFVHIVSLFVLRHMIRKGQLGAIKDQASSAANQFYSLAI